MAINLEKNREDLTEAWKDVLNDKTDTDWALFGYEGQSNDLKVVSKGSSGIEELIEDLNSGKIMYAFVRIDDPKTSLQKYVLINWQGEGANIVRKGICANHLRSIENIFTGANLTITARNEEEVEPDLIIDKVAKAGSAYSFKSPRSDDMGNTKPVGSNYKRVNPIQEINALERDQFWLKEEKEEKFRMEEERKRKETEKQKLEEEIKKRDALEAEKREEVTKRRDSSIDQIKEAEKLTKREEPQALIIEENSDKVNQSDVLRHQRNQEVHDLIAQRTIDSRSIFEKNTSAGQIKRTPQKPVRTSIIKAQQAQQLKEDEMNKQMNNVNIKTETSHGESPVHMHKLIDDQPSDDDSDQFATIKRSPRDIEKKNSVTSPSVEDTTIINILQIQETLLTNKEEPVQQITEQQFVDEVLYGDLVDTGLQARALYDYQAADDTEITFDPGDVITHIERVDEGWWQGLGPDGTYGLFPANYVEII